MVAENYRGRRLLCAYVQFLLLSGSPSEVSVFPEAEGQITLISIRPWKAAAGRCGDSSPSSPANEAFHLPDTLHFPRCLLKSLVWQRDAVELWGCQGECASAPVQSLTSFSSKSPKVPLAGRWWPSTSHAFFCVWLCFLPLGSENEGFAPL